MVINEINAVEKKLTHTHKFYEAGDPANIQSNCSYQSVTINLDHCVRVIFSDKISLYAYIFIQS